MRTYVFERGLEVLTYFQAIAMNGILEMVSMTFSLPDAERMRILLNPMSKPNLSILKVVCLDEFTMRKWIITVGRCSLNYFLGGDGISILNRMSTNVDDTAPI